MSKEKSAPKLNLQALTSKLSKIRPYLWVIMLAFFAIVYGFVLLKINSDNNQQPTASAISSDLKTSVRPAINQQVVSKLEQLQSNSVSVQSLFNQARQNPFQ